MFFSKVHTPKRYVTLIRFCSPNHLQTFLFCRY